MAPYPNSQLKFPVYYQATTSTNLKWWRWAESNRRTQWSPTGIPHVDVDVLGAPDNTHHRHERNLSGCVSMLL